MSTYDTLVHPELGGGQYTIEAGGVLKVGNLVLTVNAAGTQVIATGLATADPHVVGALWNDAGVLQISAG